MAQAAAQASGVDVQDITLGPKRPASAFLAVPDVLVKNFGIRKNGYRYRRPAAEGPLILIGKSILQK